LVFFLVQRSEGRAASSSGGGGETRDDSRNFAWRPLPSSISARRVGEGRRRCFRRRGRTINSRMIINANAIAAGRRDIVSSPPPPSPSRHPNPRRTASPIYSRRARSRFPQLTSVKRLQFDKRSARALVNRRFSLSVSLPRS